MLQLVITHFSAQNSFLSMMESRGQAGSASMFGNPGRLTSCSTVRKYLGDVDKSLWTTMDQTFLRICWTKDQKVSSSPIRRSTTLTMCSTMKGNGSNVDRYSPTSAVDTSRRRRSERPCWHTLCQPRLQDPCRRTVSGPSEL